MRTHTALATLLALAAQPALAQSWGPACPAGGAVQRSNGVTMAYLGASAANPDICRLRRGADEPADYYFGIWATAWPGADDAYAALKQVLPGPAGATVRFDVRAAPGLQWHETLRNDGRETLNVLGRLWDTMKVSHEREGFEGNTYHSIITVWRDVATGMAVYQNYQHISGHPEPGGAWDPVAVTTAR